MHGLAFVVISAFTFRVLERLNAVLTTVKPVFTAHLTPFTVTELSSLEHPVTMAFMKIFNTNSIDTVSYCQSAFGFHSVREQVLRRKINLLAKLNQCQNSMCSSLSANRVASELLLLRTQLSALAQHYH